MSELMRRIEEAAAFIRSRCGSVPSVAVILGSGLSNVVKDVKQEASIDYARIPHFPVSTVEGHPGKLLLGTWNGRQVVIMSGRFHYYEGYSMEQVTFPVRVMKLLGAETLFITNASGGLNPAIRVGELMAVTDHINLNSDHPLRGKNEEALGPRFPDQHAVYDRDLIDQAGTIARTHRIRLHQGVYVGVPGPTFETPAEYRYMRLIGGDAVGMSTVPEAIVANHMGMRIFCLSVICDEGNPEVLRRITHDEVVQAARAAEPHMAILLHQLLAATKV